MKQSSNVPIALVTGGARMGVPVAQRLIQLGYKILFTYRHSKDTAAESVKAITAAGGSSDSLACDLSDASSINALSRTITQRYGRLDVVVNLASGYESSEGKDPLASWDDQMNANARGGYLLLQNLAPLLKRSPRGRAVLISDWTSASGRPRYRDYSAYYVSKAAVKAVVESIALELSLDVLVNAIAPGPMLPPAGMSAKERHAVEQSTPLRRWGGAEEIAKA